MTEYKDYGVTWQDYIDKQILPSKNVDNCIFSKMSAKR